jgi:ABC-2 type transport system ATP-binding protein
LPIAPENAALEPPAAAPSGPALDIAHVGHVYRDRIALDDVSLAVSPGEMFALLGPNGGGKTTLFRIIATLVRPAAGSVRVFGADVRTNGADVRRLLGVVFQSPALDKRLTVRENLRHHGHLYGLRGRPLHDLIETALARVRLSDRGDDRVLALSGGLARRAEIAKALLPAPRLLLLDEPTTGLDPRVRADLWRDLRALRETQGTTIVLTTHLMDEAEACDRVAILDSGRVVLSGRPGDLTAALGGDILTIDSDRPDALAAGLRQRFQLPATVVDGVVRVERDRAHEFIGQVIDAFPGDVRSVRFSRATLHDVFVHHTGHRFD